MMIQYASDLHLEFAQNSHFLKANPLQSKGDVLLLAGDIVPFAVMHKYNDFFSYVSDHFQTTYWIPGNHEYYYFDAAAKCGTLNEKIKDNVFLVNNITINLGSINFLFSTLWSKISPEYEWQIQRGMSDFQVIKFNGHRFSPTQYNQLHIESISFIKQELLGDKDCKTVVVTHHVPTFLHYPERYKSDVLNEAFAVEMFDFIEVEGPEYWIYGHHHENTLDFKIGKTNMLTNQLGYVKYNENLLFRPDKVFSI
jgi:predicted phosphohydrolase